MTKFYLSLNNSDARLLDDLDDGKKDSGAFYADSQHSSAKNNSNNAENIYVVDTSVINHQWAYFEKRILNAGVQSSLLSRAADKDSFVSLFTNLGNHKKYLSCSLSFTENNVPDWVGKLGGILANDENTDDNIVKYRFTLPNEIRRLSFDQVEALLILLDESSRSKTNENLKGPAGIALAQKNAEKANLILYAAKVKSVIDIATGDENFFEDFPVDEENEWVEKLGGVPVGPADSNNNIKYRFTLPTDIAKLTQEQVNVLVTLFSKDEKAPKPKLLEYADRVRAAQKQQNEGSKPKPAVLAADTSISLSDSVITPAYTAIDSAFAEWYDPFDTPHTNLKAVLLDSEVSTFRKSAAWVTHAGLTGVYCVVGFVGSIAGIGLMATFAGPTLIYRTGVEGQDFPEAIKNLPFSTDFTNFAHGIGMFAFALGGWAYAGFSKDYTLDDWFEEGFLKTIVGWDKKQKGIVNTATATGTIGSFFVGAKIPAAMPYIRTTAMGQRIAQNSLAKRAAVPMEAIQRGIASRRAKFKEKHPSLDKPIGELVSTQATRLSNRISEKTAPLVNAVAKTKAAEAVTDLLGTAIDSVLDLRWDGLKLSEPKNNPSTLAEPPVKAVEAASPAEIKPPPSPDAVAEAPALPVEAPAVEVAASEAASPAANVEASSSPDTVKANPDAQLSRPLDPDKVYKFPNTDNNTLPNPYIAPPRSRAHTSPEAPKTPQAGEAPALEPQATQAAPDAVEAPAQAPAVPAEAPATILPDESGTPPLPQADAATAAVADPVVKPTQLDAVETPVRADAPAVELPNVAADAQAPLLDTPDMAPAVAVDGLTAILNHRANNPKKLFRNADADAPPTTGATDPQSPVTSLPETDAVAIPLEAARSQAPTVEVNLGVTTLPSTHAVEIALDTPAPKPTKPSPATPTAKPAPSIFDKAAAGLGDAAGTVLRPFLDPGLKDIDLNFQSADVGHTPPPVLTPSTLSLESAPTVQMLDYKPNQPTEPHLFPLASGSPDLTPALLAEPAVSMEGTPPAKSSQPAAWTENPTNGVINPRADSPDAAVPELSDAGEPTPGESAMKKAPKGETPPIGALSRIFNWPRKAWSEIIARNKLNKISSQFENKKAYAIETGPGELIILLDECNQLLEESKRTGLNAELVLEIDRLKESITSSLVEVIEHQVRQLFESTHTLYIDKLIDGTYSIAQVEYIKNHIRSIQGNSPYLAADMVLQEIYVFLENSNQLLVESKEIIDAIQSDHTLNNMTDRSCLYEFRLNRKTIPKFIEKIIDEIARDARHYVSIQKHKATINEALSGAHPNLDIVKERIGIIKTLYGEMKFKPGKLNDYIKAIGLFDRLDKRVSEILSTQTITSDFLPAIGRYINTLKKNGINSYYFESIQRAFTNLPNNDLLAILTYNFREPNGATFSGRIKNINEYLNLRDQFKNCTTVDAVESLKESIYNFKDSFQDGAPLKNLAEKLYLTCDRMKEALTISETHNVIDYTLLSKESLSDYARQSVNLNRAIKAMEDIGIPIAENIKIVQKNLSVLAELEACILRGDNAVKTVNSKATINNLKSLRFIILKLQNFASNHPAISTYALRCLADFQNAYSDAMQAIINQMLPRISSEESAQLIQKNYPALKAEYDEAQQLKLIDSESEIHENIREIEVKYTPHILPNTVATTTHLESNPSLEVVALGEESD